MNKLFQYSLRYSKIRKFISIAREVWFLKVLRKEIRIAENISNAVHEHTVFSNKRRIVKNPENPHPTAKYFWGIDREPSGDKADLLIGPLFSIDRVRENPKVLKVLSIGPRTEGEIFNILSYGFEKKNVRGLDLMSYSPYIDVGDMHNMPYDDNTFDIIVCGWVIAYSNDKQRAAKEMTRVAKNNAIISIGVSYSPLSNEEIIQRRGYLIGSKERLLSTKDIHHCFEGYLNRVYFCHDIEPDRMQDYGQIISIFSIHK